MNGTKQGEQYEYSRGQQGFGNRGQRYHGNVQQEPGIDREERHSGVGVPTCFKCGKRGHMKFDCPSRIGRVTSLGGTGSPKVIGRVGNSECEMTIDSGALITMVRADLVREEDFTGEVVALKSVCGKVFTTQTARVWLHFGEYALQHEVAVSGQLSEAVLLGMDLGLLDYLLQLEKQQRKQGLAINSITRAQARKQEEQERQDVELDAQDEAQPVSVEENEEAVSVDMGVAQAEQGVDDEVQLVSIEGAQGNEGWPMPDLMGTEEDRKALIEQHRVDKTLECVRAWAERGERGYGFQDGIIQQGEEWKRVVVPQQHRMEILKLSLSSMTGKPKGYYGECSLGQGCREMLRHGVGSV